MEHAYDDEGAERDELGVVPREREEPHAQQQEAGERIQQQQVVAPEGATQEACSRPRAPKAWTARESALYVTASQ